jgi:hypothetical protein
MCSAARLSYDDKNQLMKAAKPSQAAASHATTTCNIIVGWRLHNDAKADI